MLSSPTPKRKKRILVTPILVIRARQHIRPAKASQGLASVFGVGTPGPYACPVSYELNHHSQRMRFTRLPTRRTRPRLADASYGSFRSKARFNASMSLDGLRRQYHSSATITPSTTSRRSTVGQRLTPWNHAKGSPLWVLTSCQIREQNQNRETTTARPSPAAEAQQRARGRAGARL